MSHSRFPPVPGGYPFPELERKVLDRWREERVFQKSQESTRGRKRFVFFEGPPTANNAPHVGHAVTRVVKDLIPRYRTLRGYHVERKAGWDTHGLPVEIEVEKSLGFSGKQQIEEYGIAEFNRACLKGVWSYEKQWRAMTERIGFWVDLDNAYLTYANTYIESVWWALAELRKKDLLYKGYKIQPYCSRCGTTLSSHEVAQNYKEVQDPSVWVVFPARPHQELKTVDGEGWEVGRGLSLVAWTTTPWTLLSHAGLTVHPSLRYRLIDHPARAGECLLIGEDLETPVPLVLERDGKAEQIDLRDQPTRAVFTGEALEGLRYDRPFRVAPRLAATPDSPSQVGDEAGWKVVLGEYVTASEGTGIVHTAPLFGEDDYRTGLKYDLPQIQAVSGTGKVIPGEGLEGFTGLGFKEADPRILRDLKERGLLLHTQTYHHSYPFCWRCDEPLLYYATTSWFVRTTAEKERLIAKNREIHWHPEHVGQGRFGDWLENMVDWALSRRRYWGTPLPVWECDECDATEVMGSFDELFARSGESKPEDVYDSSQFDPHRPGIDEVSWPCAREGCPGTLRRVEEVIDAWFDSGSMSFAQHHYPFENRRLVDRGYQFPADFIAEAVDQTRGWFYTLHVLGVLLFDQVAYRNCIVLGHVNDETGRKMSKRLGNVVDPMAVIEETGADALRWYFCVNNPQLASRFSARLVREAAQKFLLPLWNVLSFFTIYANLDGWSPGRGEPEFSRRPPLDRWILLRLNRLVRETTEHLDGYRITEAARGIEAFIDELTNWYVRRSRDRFWAPVKEASAEERDAKESAYQALYEVLTTLRVLLAPMTPFLAETLHDHLVRSQSDADAESVHRQAWPEPRRGREEPELEASMATVQRIVRLGHAARNSHGLKTRQPLARVTLVAADRLIAESVGPYADLLREELNVHEIDWAQERCAYVTHEVRPVFPRCGPRFGKRMPQVKRALEAADGDHLARSLETAGKVEIEIDGERVELNAEEVEVRLVEREGLATQGDRELLVALDAELTPELVSEGLAREVVHRLQTARKESGLDYADRIRVRYEAPPELGSSIRRHQAWIAAETLAEEIREVSPLETSGTVVQVEGFDLTFELEKVR